MLSLLFLGLSCLGTRSVRDGKIRRWHIGMALFLGLPLFLFTHGLLLGSVSVGTKTALYIGTTLAGYLCVLAAGV